MTAEILRKQVLIISPFAFEPQDAGHRKRTAQTLNFFGDAEITFVLYAFEGPWLYSYQHGLVGMMRSRVSDVLVFKGRPDIGARPNNGETHHLDEWYDAEFEVYLKNLSKHRHFDVVVVHNVWMSKYFDIFHRSTVKVIEAHDIFSRRTQAFKDAAALPEFFLPTESDEVFGFGRADIVVAIQDEERRWICEHSQSKGVKIGYYPPQIHPRTTAAEDNYLSQESVTFGFLGSSHSFNVAGINQLLPILNDVIADTMAPLRLLIGGTVCDHIRLAPTFWESKGWVQNEQEFLNSVDIMIAPAMSGTGFKVKVADSICLGKPIIATRHSAIGFPLDDEWVVEDLSDMARLMAQIALRRPAMLAMTQSVRRSAKYMQAIEAADRVTFQAVLAAHQYVLVVDLAGLHEGVALLYLAGLSGAMRIGHSRARIILVADQPSVELAARRFGPNVSTLSRIPAQFLIGRAVFYIGIGVPLHENWKVLRLAKPASHSIQALPFFGDNRTWDPFHHQIIGLISKRFAGESYSGTVFLGASAVVKAFTVGMANANFKVCPSDVPEEVARFAAAIIARTVRKVIMLGARPTELEILIGRLCAVGQVDFVEIAAFHEIGETFRAHDHDRFWSRYFDKDRPEVATPVLPSDVGYPIVAPLGVALDKLKYGHRDLHPVEYDAAGKKMMWMSGDTPLILSVETNQKTVKIGIAGMLHRDVKEPEMVVRALGEEKTIRLTPGSYEKYVVEFETADVGSEQFDVQISFPKGVAPHDVIRSYKESRTLSFLVYDVRVS